MPSEDLSLSNTLFCNDQLWLVNAFSQLQKSVRANKLAHGQLIVAPENSGKQRFANTVAKSILCELSKQELNIACGHCKSCLLINANSHPDLTIIDRLIDNKGKQKNTIGIDQIRQLSSKLLDKPQLSGWRVAIVTSVEKMTRGAFNAILKTLEEPGDNTLILMLSNSLQQVPATIRSRCQPINFKLSEQLLVPWLISQSQCQEQQAKEALNQCLYAPFAALEFIQSGAAGKNQQFFDDMDKILQTSLSPHQFITQYAELEAKMWSLVASYFQKVQLSILELNNEMYKSVPNKLPMELYHQLLDFNRGQLAGSNLQSNLQIQAILIQWFEIGRKIVHYSNR